MPELALGGKDQARRDKVAASVPSLSSVDAEIYHRLHPEAFTPPESRRLRHILQGRAKNLDQSAFCLNNFRQRELNSVIASPWRNRAMPARD
ncbi:MAG: hypothetical protein U0989_04390 [Azonexus sp.]|nr:hypothetical protein [Azonexus sp.]MDZ4313986.1 hypothetical protein [Azonexus sp.]